MNLQLVIDNTRGGFTLPEMVSECEKMIAGQKQELLEDLSYYQRKHADAIRPGSSLVSLYEGHIEHINRLLTSLPG